MAEKTVIELGESTTIRLGEKDFAVIIRPNGDVEQYVPGSDAVMEQGIGLATASGMASAAAVFTGLIQALLEEALEKQGG